MVSPKVHAQTVSVNRRHINALTRLDYFDLNPKTGIIPFDPDHRLFTSLRLFQDEHGIYPSGTIFPGDETEKALDGALREQERGPDSYVWRSVGDDKTRAAHAARNNRVFAWNDPPEGGHPGEDYNCRC